MHSKSPSTMLRVSGSARIIIPSQRGGFIKKSVDTIAVKNEPQKEASVLVSEKSPKTVIWTAKKSKKKKRSLRSSKDSVEMTKGVGSAEMKKTKSKGEMTSARSLTSNLSPSLGRWWVMPLRITGVIFLAIMLVGFSFAGAAFAYQNNYEDKALFGTKILGQEMGGLTKKEIQRKVNEKLGETKFIFTIDGKDLSATPAEVGINYDEAKTAENAFNLGRHPKIHKNLTYGLISLTYRMNTEIGTRLAQKTSYRIYQNVNVEYKVNDKKMDAFTQKVSAKFNTKSKDASLVMKGTNVKVMPAVYGRAVAAESIKTQIKQALTTGQSATMDINVAEVRPEIIEAEAADSIAAAQKILERSVVYTYEGKKYTPAKEVVGGWIVFKKQNKKLVPVVDSSKVAAYLNTIAKNINIAAVNQKVKVLNGSKQEITRKGKNGLAVDVNTIAAKTATSLNSQQNVNLLLTTYAVKFKTEFNNVLVANWDKYIEVDIGSQRMCAYLKNGEKVNCWAITTGQNNVINGFNTNTPTGTFLIRRKAGAGGVAGGPGGGGVCMPNPPYKTPLCGINYVSTFTAQGHAIHEAWWRSSFGTQAYKWNGSHGCVNSPYNVAKFIYNWAPIGTPVVIHY